MTETLSEPQPMPTARTAPFDPPSALTDLPPISRLAYPDGHVGWLVTGHALAREVLADNRFSSRTELRHSVLTRGDGESITPEPPPPGFFLGMDAPHHTRLRRSLIGQFTVRRMRQLEPRIEEITQSRIDVLREQGPPADLVTSFALPIPSLVICELLGVDYADRDYFQEQSALLLDLDVSVERALNARNAVTAFMADLVRAKHAKPTDDLISGLVQAGELTAEEMAGVGFLLLIAGHETTANMLALGTMALLHHRDQWDALRADPSLAGNAVEELMRYLTIVHFGTARSALEDVELGGVRVRAGEGVTLALGTANRDPNRFDDPADLDVHNCAQGHLAFGHGIHQCLGQQLARIEMRIGYQALVRELPDLRLAVPEDEVPMRDRMAIYGVHQLPVRW